MAITHGHSGTHPISVTTTHHALASTSHHSLAAATTHASAVGVSSHVAVTSRQVWIGEVPRAIVVEFHVDGSYFGAFYSQSATPVVDVLSMEGKTSFLGATVVGILDQRLELVVFGEGENLLDRPILLENDGESFESDGIDHVLDRDV